METWEKLKTVNSAATAILLPLALAFVGHEYSRSIKEREIQGKFVELSIGILREKPTPESKNLREWAVQVLNKYSGVAMNVAATQEVVNKTPLTAIVTDRALLNRMRSICWSKVGIPADTLIVDFMLRPEFSEKRALVEACLNESK